MATPLPGMGATPSLAGGPPQIPHSLEGRDQCLACHEAGVAGAPKVPVNHAGRTSDICTACHRPSAAGAQPAGGNPTAGQATFNANCNACHPNGQAGVGPALVGLASQKSEAEIGQVIRAGKGMMPPSPGNRISDQQLADLLAYMKTLK